MTNPALPAVAAIHQLFSDPAKMAQFKELSKVPRGREYSLRLSFGHSYLPKLVGAICHRTPAQFSRVLSPDWRCSPNTEKENLADVQAELVELLRHPEAYGTAVVQCPALEELLAVPAFGWRAYDELLNGRSPRCFGEQVQSQFPGHYSRSTNRFDTSPDKVDAVYITDSDLEHYIERLPLTMPVTAPATLGEELKALDKLGLEALRLFEKCRLRGHAFHESAPASMRHRFHGDWRNAVPYDSGGTPVAANMPVFEKLARL